MRNMTDFLRLIVVAAGATLIYRYRQQITEAIENFRGPRPPNPPLPSNDAALLQKRRRKFDAF